MRYEGISAAGEKISLGDPIKVRLNMDEDAPAHGFSGVFPFRQLPPLRFCNLYDDKEKLVFGGIVDVQKAVCGSGGNLIEIASRSKAALLLDNEAKPQTYLEPSLGELFREHAAPYGLTSFKGRTFSFSWTYVIPKGISEWQVFADFCLYCMDVIPRVTPDGILDATGEMPQGELRFANEGGIPYTEIARVQSPCKRLRQLWIQPSLGAGYQRNVVDLDAVRTGIQRTRYITAANWQGKLRLKQSRRRSEEVILTCPDALTGKIGMRASVSDPLLGELRNYSVAKSTYLLDSRGERCVITLRSCL